MQDSAAEARPFYFFDSARAVQLDRAVVELLARTHKEHLRRYMPPENAHRLRHGRSWSFPGLEDVDDAELKHHSFETVTKFDVIVNHDLSEIGRFIGELARAMEAAFAKLMFSTMSDACDKSGNVVDAKEAGSAREAFAQMLEKIEFKADKDGVVQLPQIHTGSEAFRKFSQEFTNLPPEFVERIEAIKARKVSEAQDREIARKQRFLKYGGEL